MPKEYIPKRTPLDPCPIETVIAMIGGKWKARALHLLTQDAFGFAQLRRALGGVSQQVLSTQLRAMEADGLIARQDPGPGDNGAACYTATAKGRTLVDILLPVAEWGTYERTHQSRT
ncbi:winged helix-turn-helix transcriptional regulator [Gluconacetobacter asukensis]|uniref:Helix-turn-helix transcriptional regulator n=1 Tax=Gluconacetobacter asukensis TaxID=1017181 RepID=A0A7W4J3F3_9PROT|nr:helix-turn-helix domain-containing protein [Gluconacetobacter asukensis]MBB2173971.1 helix-turn-helix transcriptional regulator [Gluconacetobacter asukensis]